MGIIPGDKKERKTSISSFLRGRSIYLIRHLRHFSVLNHLRGSWHFKSHRKLSYQHKAMKQEHFYELETRIQITKLHAHHNHSTATNRKWEKNGFQFLSNIKPPTRPTLPLGHQSASEEGSESPQPDSRPATAGASRDNWPNARLQPGPRVLSPLSGSWGYAGPSAKGGGSRWGA